MKLKDIILIAAITVVCFPIALVAVMYGTGFLHLSYGWKADKDVAREVVETVKYSPYQESLAVVHSKAFKAFEEQRAELEARRQKIDEDEKRLDVVKKEISLRVEDLDKTKARLEELVKQSVALDERRVKQLAAIYGSMRPEEAAPILFTLKDELIVRIMRRIDENRQKAKIMAAMGNLSKERTGKISKLLSDVKIN